MMLLPSGWDHSLDPFAALSAMKVPAWSPTKTLPPSTAGVDVMLLPVGSAQLLVASDTVMAWTTPPESPK